jgi:molecular chaperone GrpE
MIGMGLKKDKENKKSEMDENEPEYQENMPAPEQAQSGSDEAVETGIPMKLLSVEEVEKLKSEASENLDKWKRERADFVNYKKIIERDEKLLRSNIKIDILKKYLPVLDDLERALKALPEDAQDKQWFSGIDLIYRKLQKILDTEGVVRITAETFDPTRHEAVTYEPSLDHQSGEIIEILQQGYMLGDRVVRPAQVRVAQ